MRLLLLALLAATGPAHAAEPVLGPGGWTWFGPSPPTRPGDPAVAELGEGAPADVIVFDLASCGPQVTRVDLDGGPGFRDVRVARVWDGQGWRWLDDWRLVEGWLVRPGREPRRWPADGVVDGEALRVDGDGFVTARVSARGRLEVLRGADGGFEGLRRGPVSVRLEGHPVVSAARGRREPLPPPPPVGTVGLGLEKAVASDGRTALYTWRTEGLAAVTDEYGVPTWYGYEAGSLRSVLQHDGAQFVLGAEASGPRGLEGPDGRWTCARRAVAEGAEVEVHTPGGGVWRVEQGAGGERVLDPTGGVTRTLRTAGRLMGWVDPRGRELRLVRDPKGRLVGWTGGGRVSWVERSLGGLPAAAEGARVGAGVVGEASATGVSLPGEVVVDGGSWRLRWSTAGALEVLTEPTGVERELEWYPEGGLRAVRGRLGRQGARRDLGGALVAWEAAGAAEVRLLRDPVGRVEAVVDPAGVRWSLGRGVDGRVTEVERAGARWTLARDRAGRVVEVRDPAGGSVRVQRRPGGRIEAVWRDGRHRWDLLRDAAGRLTSLRDPLGGRWGWVRDALGRARELRRSDGSLLRLERDAAGDLRAVGGVAVRRDAEGRPLGLGEGRELGRDAAGRVVSVRWGPVELTVQRGADGRVEAASAGTERWGLRRDAAGRVIGVDGAAPTEVARDVTGRVVGVRADGEELRVALDARGLPSSISSGARRVALARGSEGRVLGAEDGEGRRLGVDRAPGGAPVMLRFSDGSIARWVPEQDGQHVAVDDPDGRAAGDAAVAWDGAGRLTRVRGARAWRLLRDPLGTLIVAEAEDGAGAWSMAPDRLESPDGAVLRYDEQGRALSAGARWDERGRLLGREGEAFTLDALGRLVGWTGAEGRGARVRRDGLGRLVGVQVGGRLVPYRGWEASALELGAPVVCIPDLATWDGSRGELQVAGLPLLAVPGGALDAGPVAGAAGRWRAGWVRLAEAGGLWVGLLEHLDPRSGQPGWLLPLPWEARRWEAGAGQGPWPAPDGAAEGVPWDPGPWASEAPWGDPVRLFVEAGELPDLGGRLVLGEEEAPAPPGLPWLPASMAPTRPVLLPGDVPLPDEEPVVRWVLRMARPPVVAPAPGDLASWLLKPEIDRETASAPGLGPSSPLALPEGGR